ncbi:MAG: divalent metal cation transporter [Dehalococcoidia bacterium]
MQTAADAAAALRPLAGNGATVLFALGIIGTGLLAVPVLAGSVAYAAAELFDWPEGLNRAFGGRRSSTASSRSPPCSASGSPSAAYRRCRRCSSPRW